MDTVVAGGGDVATHLDARDAAQPAFALPLAVQIALASAWLPVHCGRNQTTTRAMGEPLRAPVVELADAHDLATPFARVSAPRLCVNIISPRLHRLTHGCRKRGMVIVPTRHVLRLGRVIENGVDDIGSDAILTQPC